ncbi:hypothetical protein BH20ACT8_BH20ACT8_13180 [soil metagenome]
MGLDDDPFDWRVTKDGRVWVSSRWSPEPRRVGCGVRSRAVLMPRSAPWLG